MCWHYLYVVEIQFVQLFNVNFGKIKKDVLQVTESARGAYNSETSRNLSTCLQKIAYIRFKINGEGDDHILCNGEAWWFLNVAVERINEYYASYNGQLEVNDKEVSAALMIKYICKCFVITVCDGLSHAGRLCAIHFLLNFLHEIKNKNTGN